VLGICFLRWLAWKGHVISHPDLAKPTFLTYLTHCGYYSPNPQTMTWFNDKGWCNLGCPYCATLFPRSPRTPDLTEEELYAYTAEP
jgi:hypothetical protein